MFKKGIALTLIFMMVLVFSVGCSGSTSGGDGQAADPVHLKLSITVSENSSWYEGAVKFKELIEEKTNGQYIVDIYPSEQLAGGNTVKGIEMVQSGAIDIDIHSTIIWTAIEPKFTVVNMPWLIPSYEKADAAFTDENKQLLFDLASAKGVKPLAFGESGFRQLTNNKNAIQTPEDLSGLKIRVPGIKMYVDLFTELGADPTSMNFSEVFTALQTGTIDGQENPFDVTLSAKLEEVQKYLTVWNYSYDALLMTMNQTLWDGLDDNMKTIFQESATEAMDYQKQRSREINTGNLEYMKTKMEVYEMPDEEIAVFRELAQPIYDSYEETIGLDLLEAFGYEK
jgi:tripartite ATP-independent transporter DctP family solute receptor